MIGVVAFVIHKALNKSPKRVSRYVGFKNQSCVKIENVWEEGRLVLYQRLLAYPVRLLNPQPPQH